MSDTKNATHTKGPRKVGKQHAAAADVLLRMIRNGAARFEPSTGEFCFGGLRYSPHVSGNWNSIVSFIGWEKCRAAAEGRTT